MSLSEFINTKIGDKVIIGGNSKFKGQTATVIDTQGALPNGRRITVQNETIEEQMFYYGILQLIA